MGQSRRALPLEMILITIVVLFLIAVLAILILGSLQSVNTANQYLPTVPAPTK